MPTKQLFVLANSIKNHNRCVAGRELVNSGFDSPQWSHWLRPVSNHDKGAVSEFESMLDNRSSPRPLDVIQVPVSTYEADPLQPENWQIQSGRFWELIDQWPANTAVNLEEKPENIWLEPNQRSDRVSTKFLNEQESLQSLYLIKPESCHILIRTNQWEEKKQIRAVFCYNGKIYNCSLTDPLITSRYCPNFRNGEDRRIELQSGDNCLLCISYTPEFQDGLHYKIVASIIELGT